MLREMLWKTSPARAQLLGMCDDYQDRQKLKDDPRRLAGEPLVKQLRRRCCYISGAKENLRLLVGFDVKETLFDYSCWYSEFYALDGPCGGEMHFRGIKVVGVDDPGYIGFFRVLPNRWVALGGAE